jgi:hypothetical protein
MLKQWQAAESDYNAAIALASDWSMFWHGRARLAIDQGQWDAAERDLAEAFALPALRDERARQTLTRAHVTARRLMLAISQWLAAENRAAHR